jgi:general secretion pathway protein K
MKRDLSRKRPYRARSNEEGFILVTVLIVIALLFPLVLAFNSKVQLNLTQAENFRNSIQALRMARSGVEGAIGILKASDPTYDSPRSSWATGFPALSLGQGILKVSIVDEDGRIPVNNLVASPTPPPTGAPSSGTAPIKTTTATTAAATTPTVNKDLNTQLRAIITKLGGKPEIVDALIDWLDPDNIITGSAGAEEAYYRGLGYHCKHGPLDSLDELVVVMGFDKELVDDRGFRDYLTVAPTDGKINVNTAPLEVLQAVLGTQTGALAQPLTEADIEDLDRYRNEHELKSLGDINAVKISSGDLGKITPLLKVNSSYFTVSSAYTLGKVTKNVAAVLKRAGSTVSIISWRES